jgi:NADPH:quinone reductase-like Zn-dependent oxidoreductase
MTATTRSVLIERVGPPDVLVERDVRLPQVGPEEVRLRVEATGVNFADLLMRAGLYGTVPPRPYAPGFEVAGVVTRVGSSVTEFAEGDSVVALMRYGGYARDVVVPVASATRYPSSLTPAEAAAIPVVFLTATVCLFESARAREGESVLVLGAGGGVGTAAVQLAALHGLRVIGTAGSTRKRDFVTGELGAEVCFDSRGAWEPKVRALVGERGIDVALDPVGGKATASCLRLLAPLGRLVFYGLSEGLPGNRRNLIRAARAWLGTPRIHPLSLIELNASVQGVHLLHLGAKEALLSRWLQEVLATVGEGKLRPVLDRVFPLDRDGAVAAHAYLHGRHNLGKVVLAAPP